MLPRLLIVGGGPIGIEMAVAAVLSKKWEVTIVERGSELCSNVKQWEHVKLFSAWKLNVSDAGREALSSAGVTLPECKEMGKETDADYPTGKELLDHYLRPLGNYLAASGLCKVLLDTDAVSIGKSSKLLKGDMGKPRRKGASFRTLVATRAGEAEEEKEEIIVSDAVVDASGTYGNGNWLGVGGLPAVGERSQTVAANIVRTIPNVAANPERYLNKTTAIVGSGYSAITTINKLKELAAANTAAMVGVHWLTRRGNDGDSEGGTPLYEQIENDPLPQRETLSKLANVLASSSNTDAGAGAGGTAESSSDNFKLVHHPHVQIETITSHIHGTSSTVNLLLRCVKDEGDEGAAEGKMHTIKDVSTVVSNVGYRPDSTIYQELQVHQCYASEGPMKLAAALMSSSGAGSVDCLAQVAPGKETMVNPEPSFFIVGMKSYGRSSKFLLTIGHEQVQHVLELLNEGM